MVSECSACEGARPPCSCPPGTAAPVAPAPPLTCPPSPNLQAAARGSLGSSGRHVSCPGLDHNASGCCPGPGRAEAAACLPASIADPMCAMFAAMLFYWLTSCNSEFERWYVTQERKESCTAVHSDRCPALASMLSAAGGGRAVAAGRLGSGCCFLQHMQQLTLFLGLRKQFSQFRSVKSRKRHRIQLLEF